MTREEAILILEEEAEFLYGDFLHGDAPYNKTAFDMAIEALQGIPLSEQYKKGFEDAERAFLVEYAREAENMRKRSVQLEVMLNAQKAISAEAVQVVRCKDCRYYECGGLPCPLDVCETLGDDGFCSMGERREE